MSLRPSRLPRKSIGHAALALALVGLLLSPLAACGGQAESPAGDAESGGAPPAALIEEGEIPGLRVTGEFGRMPTLEFSPPLDVDAARYQVLVEGEAGPIDMTRAMLLRYYLADAATGDVEGETFSTLPALVSVDDVSVGSAVRQALSRVPSGSRFAIEIPASDDASHSVVGVVDALPSRAVGVAQETRDGDPVVTLDDVGAPSIDLPDSALPPAELVSRVLVEGAGPEVEADDYVVAQVFGMGWSGDVQESTWDDDGEPMVFPLSQAVEGLRLGLPGVTVGSQVLLEVPAELASGDGAMIYVVDVLATSPSAGAAASSTPAKEETP